MLEIGQVDIEAMLGVLANSNLSQEKSYLIDDGWPEEIEAEIASIVDQVGVYYPSKRRGRTFLGCREPGDTIPPHRDYHEYCECRVHVPLISNPEATITVDGETYHMEVGWIYEINPSLEHSVNNAGVTSRVHLIFNMV